MVTTYCPSPIPCRTLTGIVDDYLHGYYSDEMIEAQVRCTALVREEWGLMKQLTRWCLFDAPYALAAVRHC